MRLKGKRIILGVSGGIAAYKVPYLIRLLTSEGVQVRVVLTQAAKAFVTPLTLQAVSGHVVSDDLFDSQAELSMGHIELAKWADLILIAPATADLIARLQVGMGNDLLTTLCLASAAPVVIAPAMNQQMYLHKATQHNLQILRFRGVIVWGPENGIQACGDNGPGRMLAPEELLVRIKQQFCLEQDLTGLKILVTAGPTHEYLDPVRYITNPSSGKMGYAIAQVAAERGAQVTLISGPVALPTPIGVERINVISALDMQQQVMVRAKEQQIVIGCAAVSDYRATQIAVQKLKKQGEEVTISFTQNPDIISQVGNLTHDRPFVVGFAAETHDISHYAKKKLQKKHLDLICANDVSISDEGFGSEVNSLQLFWPDGYKLLPKANKQHLAQQLISEIIKLYEKNRY